VTTLPPEDQPDVIWIGPVGPIPVHYDDDPRLEEERAVWSAAQAKAQAMHAPDQLLAGLEDADWRVRLEVIDRLAARAKDDPRTPEALARTLAHDAAWQVRDTAAMALAWFITDEVVSALRDALRDPNDEVRRSAARSLAFIEQG
jgi:HEAT repeat protein